MRPIKAILIALLLSTAPSAWADNRDPVTAFKARSGYCDETLLPDDATVFFPEMLQRARHIKAAFCDNEPPPVDQRLASVVTLFLQARDEFLRVSAFARPASDSYSDLAEHLARAHQDGRAPATLNSIVTGAGVAIDLLELRPADEAACDNQVATRWPDKDCADYAAQFRRIYNHTQRVVSGPGAAGATAWLQQLERQWERYFRQSRSQTALELAVNGWLFKRRNTAHRFLPPPDRQWVLLHPDIALQHLPGARDGAQTQEALLIEVIGRTGWRSRPWYQPAGASLVALYADRPDTRDWAPGLAVHLRNHLSLGYSYHDGEGGLFLSLDLGKMLQDKAGTLDAMRGHLRAE